jgi:IS4 transposase
LAEGGSIAGRVVAVRLPHALAARAQRRVELKAVRKQHATTDRRTLEAARYVLLFTTLSAEQVDAATVTEIYRFRWQIELAFKRHKQILELGRLPHKDAAAAQGWILSKLVMALLLERLYRNAVAISPWGYRIEGASTARSAAA